MHACNHDCMHAICMQYPICAKTQSENPTFKIRGPFLTEQTPHLQGPRYGVRTPTYTAKAHHRWSHTPNWPSRRVRAIHIAPAQAHSLCISAMRHRRRTHASAASTVYLATSGDLLRCSETFGRTPPHGRAVAPPELGSGQDVRCCCGVR